MQILRTPDARFHNLPDYPFVPRYLTIPDLEDGELRVHYLDEGSGETVLLLHGEPTWSYLYRHMIPPLVGAGFRVVAPDLVGFGRSDKPAGRTDHSYARQVAWMRATLFDALDLNHITLFCQDWGGLIGLRLVAGAPERFARLVIANSGLPMGEGEMPEAFRAWLAMSQNAPELPVGAVVQQGTQRTLSEGEVAAYDAPFPDESYKAGARVLPALVPTTPESPGAADNRAAWEVLARFDKPVLTAFSDGDPITRGSERAFQTFVPGAKGQPHVTIEGGGHFLQEDKGAELAALVTAFAKK